MFVKLVSHHVPNRPDWVVINEEVPIGTRYEVIGYDSRFTLVNFDLGEEMKVEVYYVRGNGSDGWTPTFCFEVVKEES